MNQYIVINRIQVQNANAIAGFTWGFPAITHFLGFVHNLTRKLADTENYQDITLTGCAVIAHEHKVHTFGSYERRFIQSRNPPYMKKDVDKVVNGKAPSVIEEGKMNMTVSLLVEFNGNIGNREEGFLRWVQNACLLQRLAGGMILNIGDIQLHVPENSRDVMMITRKLLPGFVLLDRSSYLENHYHELLKDNSNAELLDAWLDFSALKQKARPKSDLILRHLHESIKNEPDNQHLGQLFDLWQQHLGIPYETADIPADLRSYFGQIEENRANKKLLEQWKEYCEPGKKTDADWEYIPKPETGFLVPIVTGYKAISPVYKNAEVGNTRDNETDVCFVESVHTIGEWQSAHHVKDIEQLKRCVWRYHYEENWYLCRQAVDLQASASGSHTAQYENTEEEIYS